MLNACTLYVTYRKNMDYFRIIIHNIIECKVFKGIGYVKSLTDKWLSGIPLAIFIVIETTWANYLCSITGLLEVRTDTIFTRSLVGKINICLIILVDDNSDLFC